MRQEPDLPALVEALRAAGFCAVVEADGALAILVIDPATPFPGEPTRLRLIELARAAGFSHVALELTSVAFGRRDTAGPA